ncbi:MAG: hypothetical protein ACK4UQ_06530 [Brevundimonas sp.]
MLKLVLLEPGVAPVKEDFRTLTTSNGPRIKSVTLFKREEVVRYLKTRDWQGKEPWVLEGSFLIEPDEVRSWISAAASSADD